MSNIPWLSPVIDQFTQQVMAGANGHAYLIGMHQGYGAWSLTLALAKIALCLSPTPDGACGHCKACLLVAADSHPDLYSVEADGNQIKVDQIRTLCSSLTSTAQQGGRRVAIIKSSEKLNTAAANALLKTLEEPGRDTLIFLQTDTPSRLMATISSRCQRLHFQLPSPDTLRQWIAAQITCDHDVTWCLPAMGGPIELLSALQSERYQQLLVYRKGWIQSLSSGHLCASLTNIDEKQVSDALKVLYLVLRYKLVKQKNADALVNVKLVTFAGQVMETYHRLNTMPNVNVMAVFQAFILEYESLTTR